jgi:hypothetical protein
VSAWAAPLDGLRAQGRDVDPGLSDDELDAVELRLQISFPPDLRALLATGVPRGDGFPDWHRESDESLRARMQAPVDGVLFDVERDGAWLATWGRRPDDPGQAVSLAEAQLAQAPALVAVYGHRYIPAEPGLAGNPVFSIHQSDVIVYGSSLASYLAAEFGVVSDDERAGLAPRHIPVWSDLVI